MPNRYRDALALPEFRAIFLAHVIAMTGTVLAQLALTVLVFARTGSALLSALTFTTGFLPYLLSGTLLSAIVDRVPTRRLLVGCNVLSGLVAAVMALPGTPVAVLLVLAFLLGAIRPVFNGARAATLPEVLPDNAYVPGRSLIRMVAQVAQVAGFALSGILLTVVDPRTLLLSNAVCFGIAAALLQFWTRERRPRVSEEKKPSLVQDSLAGLRDVFANPALRRILVLGWAVPALAVMPEAMAVPYVARTSGGTAGVGLLLTAIPLGTVLGEAVTNWRVPPERQIRHLRAFAILTFVPLLFFVFTPSIPLAILALFASGLGAAFHLGLDRLLLGTSPKDLLSRTLSLQAAGLMFFQGIGYAVAGGAAEVLTPGLVVAAAGICGLLAVVLYTVADLHPFARLTIQASKNASSRQES